MNRRERRLVKHGKFADLGRDEWFQADKNPVAVDRSQAIIAGMNSTAKRGKSPKGGNKGGSWGPQADGGG